MSDGQNRKTRLSRRHFLIATGGAILAGIGGGMLLTRNSWQASNTQQVKLKILGRSAYHEEINNKLMDLFRQRYPNVKFDYLPKGYIDEYQLFVLSMRNRSTEYDAMYLDEPWIALAIDNGWLELIDGADLSGYPKYLASWGKRGSRVYALPLTGNANFLFYRKDILDAVGVGRPETWDDVLKAAKRIKEKYTDAGVKIYGFSANMRKGVAIAQDVFPGFLYPFGGKYFASDGKTPALNSPEAVEALEFMKELLKYSHPRTTEWTNLTEYSEAIRRGEVAMGLVWNGWIKDVDVPEKSQVVGKIHVMSYPRQKIDFGAQSGVWFYTVSTFSQNKKLAENFVKFATSLEAQKTAHLEAGLPPTRLKVFKDPEVKSRNRLAEEYYEIVSVVRPVRTSPRWMDMAESVGTYLYLGLTGQISSEEAIRKAHGEMVKVA